MNSPKIERALLSVSDKTGLTELAQGLTAAGIALTSTGGTRRHLEAAGFQVQDIAAYTGFPEMMAGRLKTLHPAVHGGILCRRDQPDDMRAIEERGFVPFELVVVNLYPFEATVAKEGVTREEAVEQIDIGGPTIIRAASKNHAFVTVVTDPSQYGTLLDAVSAEGRTTPDLRARLAVEAFARTARYDRAIADFFGREATESPFPAHWSLDLTRQTTLRYGENPHQAAALYADGADHRAGLVRARQLNGKELSYNNLLDLDSAWALARLLPPPATAVIKHNNPCGAATAESLAAATRAAWDSDPTSAFGSVVAMNVAIDAATAEVLVEPGKFVEAIVAPSFDDEAFEILTTRPKWKANVRLLAIGPSDSGDGPLRVRQIDGGFLVQQPDSQPDPAEAYRLVTEAEPTTAQRAELAFAWDVCRHVKSNAIVLAQGEATVGVGAGQMSRIDAVELAIRKAGERSHGSVLASDAFFPFDDSIHRAAEAGVTAIIQPGGSRRDEGVIAACDQHGIPMLFTGQRHFRH
ncbi:MAG: bifunctional phosphoribosylaminoimidazolecarboxamide formyltransferase/IMP cyclohydrolase [Pirellulales bacterium]